MWAGGRLDFVAPLTVGAAVRRESTITAIDEKAGRTGSLLFVTVRHEVYEGERVGLREEQDIVYREPTPPRLASGQACPSGDWEAAVHPTPMLLFRYSAVTFNGHRIHYDHPYVTETEGYPGLVVHGPLIATLALRAFSHANPQARVRRFAYRGLRPLIAPQPFAVSGRIDGPGHAETWAGNADGLAQTGTVEFES
jgi:itaconyl-CoA hydratase/mesaconyl-C4 CoA hydratase